MQRAAIIIVTYNAEKYIDSLLNSLKRLDYPVDNLKIFIIDNNSSDQTIPLIKKYFSTKNKIELINNKKNLGFAEGNNVGLRLAIDQNFNYLVLLNQDMEVDPSWLNKLIDRAESDEKIGAVQAMTLLHPETDLIYSTGARLHYLGIGYSGNHKLKIDQYQSQKNFISYANGAAVLFKRKILKQVGIFDEKFFMYHEDTDLCWRIRLAGRKIVLAEEAICYHKFKFNRSKLTFFWIEKNRLYLLLKNWQFKTLILILPMIILFEFSILFYALFNGWLWQKLRSYWWILKNLKYILNSRQQIQQSRKVTDRQLKKYLTHRVDFTETSGPIVRFLFNPISRIYWFLIKSFI